MRLIPAAYVKPFVRRNKTDARDAAAICTAQRQPDMRPVPIKSAAEQARRGLERSRELLIKQHTQLCNSVRSQLAEHGVVAAKGRRGFVELQALLASGEAAVPEILLAALQLLVEQIVHLARGIETLEAEIVVAARADAAMRRLGTIPGVGPILAHAIVAAVGDGSRFRSARDFAAPTPRSGTGLTPRARESAGKHRQSGISRQGEPRLRKLFVLGASTVMRSARLRSDRATAWQRGILARRPVKVAVLAQAAKTARIAFAVLRSGEPYRTPRPAAA